MASKVHASALLLALNLLLLFSTSSSSYVPCPPPPQKPPTPSCSKCLPPSISHPSSCPRDTLKLGVCASILGLGHVVVGKPPKTPCCALLDGLINLEAAICLCTAIKANVLGAKLDVPVSLTLLLNYCGKKVPAGFQCA